jgi:hypothetical protein
LSVPLQASSESTASRLIAHESPEGRCNRIERGLIAPTVDEVAEELLDLLNLQVELLSAFGEGKRDFPLVAGGGDALDEFSFDQTIDQTTRTARFADKTFPNFDQGKGLCFVKNGEHFGLGRAEAQRANLLREETRAFTLCS